LGRFISHTYWGEFMDLVSVGRSPKWVKRPPNRRFVSVSDGELPIGAKFDRFGGRTVDGRFVDTGTFVAPFGADFEGLALPDSTKSSPLKGYEVLKPIPMREGPAIPWFGKKGGGTQWELSMGIEQLKSDGTNSADHPDRRIVKRDSDGKNFYTNTHYGERGAPAFYELA
jgi:hypothetical protein